MKKNKPTDERLKKGMFKNAEKWANRTLEEIGLKQLDEKFERRFLDYAIFGELEYPIPLTEEEEQAFLNKYNEDNPDQHTNIEYLSREEIIKRYGHNLTEEQLKELENYGRL